MADGESPGAAHCERGAGPPNSVTLCVSAAARLPTASVWRGPQGLMQRALGPGGHCGAAAGYGYRVCPISRGLIAMFLLGFE